MNSRCIMVLGVPRSGTSAVAGALHHLGVDMGTGYLQLADSNNPTGYYEDLRWQKLNKQLTGERYGHNQPETISERQASQYRALAVECMDKPLWGIKDPRLCFTAHFIWPYLEECKVVVVHRSPAATAESLMRHSRHSYKGHYGMTLGQAMDLRDLWAEAMNRRIKAFQGPIHHVQYEELLNSPIKGIDQLARFAFHGICGRLPDYEAARQFIDPKLRHHG